MPKNSQMKIIFHQLRTINQTRSFKFDKIKVPTQMFNKLTPLIEITF